VRDFILELKKEGKTIFFNTHNLDEAQRMCDKIGILKTRLLVVDTPEHLEKSVLQSKTVIQLKQVTDAIVAEVKNVTHENLSLEGNTITITTPDPLKVNPELVRAIVLAGGEIQFVTEHKPKLEDVYLKIMQETV